MRFCPATLVLSVQLLLAGCNALSNRFKVRPKVHERLFIAARRAGPCSSADVGLHVGFKLGSEASGGPGAEVQDTAKKIKLLRSSTGRGAQDCFKALNEAKGDVRLASQILLDALKGTAPKESGSESDLVVMMQGTIAVSCTPSLCSIVDFRCDSDFVGKNKVFTSLAKSVANAALQWKTEAAGSPKSAADLKTGLLAQRCLRCGSSLAETGRLVQSAIRESMSVARVGFVEPGKDEFVVFYVHSCLDPAESQAFSGPSASILSFSLPDTPQGSFYSLFQEPLEKSETNCCMTGSGCVYTHTPTIANTAEGTESDELKRFLRDLAIHVVAEKPTDIDIESFDKDGLAESVREAEALLASGKPQEVVDKIVKGRLKKKYGDSVLMEQAWIFGNDPVSQVIRDTCSRLGREIRLRRFVTYAISDDLIKFRHPKECTFYNTNITF